MTVTQETVSFTGGAVSSRIPRYDLIPRGALKRVADRFELGLQKHGERAWNARTANQQCLEDKEFLIARAAHAIDHALKLIAKLEGLSPADGDDDAAAIAWAGICLCEGTKMLPPPGDHPRNGSTRSIVLEEGQPHGAT
jgi:hypothetical protein